MKKVYLTLLTSGLLLSCHQAKQPADTANPSAAQAEAATGNTYGAVFTAENVINTGRLLEMAQGKDSLQAVVQAEIVESCQAKGCWMDVKLTDSTTMKVSFRDYGFFLPVADLKGRTVVFTGTAQRQLISVDDQRHFAQDAGKSEAEIAAITTPKEELRFVADGVILK